MCRGGEKKEKRKRGKHEDLNSWQLAAGGSQEVPLPPLPPLPIDLLALAPQNYRGLFHLISFSGPTAIFDILTF